MTRSVLLASVAPEPPEHVRAGRSVLRWPDDGPDILERRWERIAPALESLAGATGTVPVGVDEASALPHLVAAATVLELSRAGGPVLLTGEPAALASLVGQVLAARYAEDRLLGAPVDILARLTPALRALPAAGPAAEVIAASRSWLAALRDPGRWCALVDDDEAGARVGRMLSLAGIHVAARPDDAPRQARLEPVDGGYLLALPVHRLRKDRLRLASARDRLLVTTDGRTVPVELPSALRRCRVAAATVDGDELVVRFETEQESWR